MATYLDTGAGDATQSLGRWLDANLIQGIQEFHAQFAYFTYSALNPYATVLRGAVTAGFPVHLVLGSNEQSLVADDLRKALEITKNAPNASLTVVAYSNAKFHPKTVQVVRSDGSAAASVGSGNFTHRGLGWNVEAAIALDTAEGDAAPLMREIADAIDRWRSLTESGVFPIRAEADIQSLLTAGVISSTPPARPPSALTPVSGTGSGRMLGSRQRLWRPPANATTSPASLPPTLPLAPLLAAPIVGIPAPAAVLPPQRWYKQMPSSDAQQVRPGTNPTGKLRLTKSDFPIDKTTFFRNDLFGSATWRSEIGKGLPYEVADIAFAVDFHGTSLGVLTLAVDHAPHRVSGQDNVPTVLAWGPVLGARLVATSCVNDWVVIERDAWGVFSLSIQATRP